MSDAKKKNVSEPIFKNNRDRLVKLLLNEISRLDELYYESKCGEFKDRVSFALETLENLLKIQGYIDQELSVSDFKLMAEFIYNIFKDIVNQLPKGECER